MLRSNDGLGSAPDSRPQNAGFASLLILFNMLAGSVSSSAQDLPEAYTRCSSIADEKLRLQCFDRLVRPDIKGSIIGNNTPFEASPWRLVRSRDPQTGREAQSITRTADISRSDPELAGLMIRCAQTKEIEVLVVILQPLTLRSHPSVTVTEGGSKSSFQARMAPPGALVLLPDEAIQLANGPWQNGKELDIRIEDPELNAHGIIPLDGLTSGLANLRANCPTGDAPPQ